MKQYSKKLFSLVIFFSTSAPLTAMTTTTTVVGDDHVAPFIQFRSQGRDTARKLEGMIPNHIYLDDEESIYGTFNATFQYDRSFKSNKLTRALFGDSLVSVTPVTGTTTTTMNSCNSDCDDNNEAIVVSGSLVTGRVAATDLMAENFLLPRDFRSVITFRPRVQDFLVDFNLYVGLDRWVQGLYFRLYGPVVSNKCTLHAQETVTAPGTADGGLYVGGFFASANVPTTSLFPNALSFFSGAQLPVAVPGITYIPLAFAKISPSNDCLVTTPIVTANTNPCCDDDKDHHRHGRKTGFAELRGEFGWNYIQENYHVGLNIQAAAPTGSRPNAQFLFESQVGNGRHWELGGGFMAGYTFWRNEDGDKSLTFTFEADITHLFKAKQYRTFDLINKPLSRYMLAEQVNLAPTGNLFGSTTPIATASAGTAPIAQFNSVYEPVANLSTRQVKVSIGAQADLVAMFTYAWRGFSWDLGYNFWGMSREKISSSGCDDNCGFTPNTWALKGDAQVFGFIAGAVVATPVPLSATESLATIHTGTNIPFAATQTAGTPAANPNTNPGIDNPQFAQTTAVAATAAAIFEGFDTPPIQVETSIQPVYIKVTDFDIEGAEIRGISNKVFTHFSYAWIDREKWVPYIGAGISAEFGTNRHNGDDDDCNATTPVTTTSIINSCSDDHRGNSIALSKWAVEIKGGVSFN